MIRFGFMLAHTVMFVRKSIFKKFINIKLIIRAPVILSFLQGYLILLNCIYLNKIVKMKIMEQAHLE